MRSVDLGLSVFPTFSLADEVAAFLPGEANQTKLESIFVNTI